MENTAIKTLVTTFVFILALLWSAAGFSEEASKGSNVLAYEKALKEGMPILVDVSSPT